MLVNDRKLGLDYVTLIRVFTRCLHPTHRDNRGGGPCSPGEIHDALKQLGQVYFGFLGYLPNRLALSSGWSEEMRYEVISLCRLEKLR